MISVKIASIMAIAAFVAGSLFAPPVQQAIAAVIATDVQCTGCVGTSDVAGSAITAAKIKDGEVKAAEIATDAVGAAEIQGVTKLMFAQCNSDSSESSTNVLSGKLLLVTCSINGVDTDDTSTAAMSGGNGCFGLTEAVTNPNEVDVYVRNFCTTTEQLGSGAFGIMVFDK